MSDRAILEQLAQSKVDTSPLPKPQKESGIAALDQSSLTRATIEFHKRSIEFQARCRPACIKQAPPPPPELTVDEWKEKLKKDKLLREIDQIEGLQAAGKPIDVLQAAKLRRRPELEESLVMVKWRAGYAKPSRQAACKQAQTGDDCSTVASEVDLVKPEFTTVQDICNEAQFHPEGKTDKAGDKEQEVRRAAYVRGLSEPAFIPTWQLPAPLSDASAAWPTLSAASAVAAKIMSPVAVETNTADLPEDWEVFADMEADDTCEHCSHNRSKTRPNPEQIVECMD